MGNSTAATEIFLWYFLPTVVTVPPLGLPTNAWVIYLLLGKPGICSTSEIFTLNLAVIDMLFCITVVGECINIWFNQSMEATSFVAWGLNQGGGPLFLCFLSLDSYVAVCHPVLSAAQGSQTAAVVMLDGECHHCCLLPSGQSLCRV